MQSDNPLNGTMLLQLIDSHSRRVGKRSAPCATSVCCHCGLDAVDARNRFARHGIRARRFLVLVGSYVVKVTALLARWRCPRCRRTFTDYPSFACPYKGYTLPQIADRATRYVSDPSTSYRKGVCTNNVPIFYAEGRSDESVQDPTSDLVPNLATVAHTSLFRWISALGGKALEGAAHLQRRCDPAPHKFTSESRRCILVACRATCSALLANRASGVMNC